MIRKLKEWLCKHDWSEAYEWQRGRTMVCEKCRKFHVVTDHWR